MEELHYEKVLPFGKKNDIITTIKPKARVTKFFKQGKTISIQKHSLVNKSTNN
ncbi:hypothetical protein AsFPU1_4283 [Aphanothece sacrum FPU1]|uniref:Uncharacterized protein n=1 Tax=Aphanothece sacrum FPU1 TaxID=1920663 RepID=A0A401INM5_APHSA|nr:hypothetical protein AsFPU1_4283 [Aphanothece sacrum FPU1]